MSKTHICTSSCIYIYTDNFASSETPHIQHMAHLFDLRASSFVSLPRLAITVLL